MWFRLSVLFTVCLVSSSFAQKTRDYRHEARLLKNALLQGHIQPRTLNDEFSAQVFDAFLNQLDGERIYMTKAEAEGLQAFRSSIDNELNDNTWKFLQHLLPVYKKSLERAQGIVQQTLQQPFTDQVKEYFREDTVQWPASDVLLKEKWRLLLKFETFDRLADMQKNKGTADKNFFATNEPVARQRTKAFELRAINRLLNHPAGFENYIVNAYFKCIASVFDPHTTYLSITDMENFLSSLSTEGYYFGITLDENDRGDVLIAALAPGGPAWKSGELQAADQLINLRWEGQSDVDVSGLSLEEANQILEDANHETMEFTVRKPNGVSSSVKLRKEKISMEDNFVRSYILTGKKKVGYISLPDFYTQWGDDSEGSRCANDVAKEIMKLKGEGMEGLILDLRFNGGGSLPEAVSMAGIFIEEGPLVVLTDKNKQADVIKDMNRGVVYDGPLVVLVNGQSASASEMLAGALQDYNRGVIVGSRTYGKATAQNFTPLDPKQQEPTLESVKNGLGYASITMNKIYRVTGMTAQGGGVIPDIGLPDIWEKLVGHESSLPFSLKPDTLKKKIFYHPLLPLPLLRLKEQNCLRMETSDAFTGVWQSKAWVSAYMEKAHAPVLLAWKEFNEQAQQEIRQSDALKNSWNTPTASYEVANNTLDQARMIADDYAKDFNTRWLSNLKKDAYVEEAFQITCDLISMTFKK